MKNLGRLAALSVLAGMIAGCAGRNAVIEIPEGYKGWVVIEYVREDCPFENESPWVSRIRITPDGRGCSRTWKGTEVLTRLVYFYVDQDGVRTRKLEKTGWGEGGEIWAGRSTPDEAKKAFFVGTEQEFKSTTTGPRY